MPEDNPMLLEVTNNNQRDIRVNDQSIPTTESRSYRLRLPSIRAENTDTTIQITLDGEEVEHVNPSKGICLCLTAGTTITLTLADSINIAINEASVGPGLGGGPEGVHCGDGS